MSYALGYGICYSCKQPFTFNPRKVPSLTLNGRREPFCRKCIDEANVVRKEKGLPLFILALGAYEPCDERELGE
jgi:hypothetical protein